MMTDVGIDSRAIGATTAYSPAHNSDLIPETIHVADKGSTLVTLRRSKGEPDNLGGGVGEGRDGKKKDKGGNAPNLHIPT